MIRTEDKFIEDFEKRLREVVKSLNSMGKFDGALEYACFSGGKRMRPRAVHLGVLAAGNKYPNDEILDLAVAIELIHSYSLVHDDLPAMDNDTYRRESLTVHAKYGEGVAILVGDALLSLAAKVLAEGAVKYPSSFARATSIITSSACDMVIGQVLDIDGCENEDEYLNMYSLKTGALIRAAFLAGAIVGGAEDKQYKAVEQYAKAIGLAFQLVDDLLDVGEDDSLVSVIGEKRVKDKVTECLETAISASSDLPQKDLLKEFATMLATRNK